MLDTTSIQDATPRTMYVMRPVLNAREIIAWAKKQGFKSTLRPQDLHVTVAFSRAKVNWFAAGHDSERVVIPRGGPRAVEKLGDQGAVVLLFSSWELQWRHEQFANVGASWDHDEYQPHITLTYGRAPADLDALKAYAGPIVLGPEQFSEVNEDWAAEVEEE